MKQIINSESAPNPIGPYNQSVRSGNLIYTSGQIPIDPSSGELVQGGIREQTIQVFKNLKAVLSASNVTLESVVKTTVFLADLNDFSEFNAVYAEHFSEECAPARSTVQVAALPKGALVEIELLAEIA